MNSSTSTNNKNNLYANTPAASNQVYRVYVPASNTNQINRGTVNGQVSSSGMYGNQSNNQGTIRTPEYASTTVNNPQDYNARSSTLQTQAQLQRGNTYQTDNQEQKMLDALQKLQNQYKAYGMNGNYNYAMKDLTAGQRCQICCQSCCAFCVATCFAVCCCCGACCDLKP